jgi:hypothetical protein
MANAMATQLVFQAHGLVLVPIFRGIGLSMAGGTFTEIPDG